uniref:ODAD1 central coiled coil region domain-containing protein n=1 Tax=Mola mola TaxID=94237 RepID=A0A3Q3W0R4_MOLML
GPHKMPFSAIKPPLQDQIMEMQRKIQLVEGERDAYYETSQATMKKNAESIRQLRQDNKRLYKKLAEASAGDESVIRAAFHDRGLEKDAYRNMSREAALNTADQKVLSKMKRLNALKHTTQTQQRRLEKLQLEYQRMKPKAGSGAQSNLRALENSLEKTHFKCKEAENIMVNYQKLKRHLQEESLTFQGQLDSLEAEILKHREELHDMQVMNNDAQLAKDAAKAELQQLEDQLYKERKERERIVGSYRKQVEEHSAQAEKVDRKTQRTVMQLDELNSDAQRSSPRATGVEKVTSTYDEAFRRIKEATGVRDIMKRFTSQKETHQCLLKLKEENEEVLQQLKEQQELLSKEYQDMKYSGEAQLSSNKQVQEEREHQLAALQQRREASEARVDRLVRVLGTVRAGVEHLADKLCHITLVSPESDEFVLVLMTQCEQKLQLLHGELEGQDLATVMKEMEEEEFHARIEGKLPAYNTRVKLPEGQSVDLLKEESDEDEADVITREALKHQSQLIIDSKSKKKPWKKKQGRF